MFDVKEKPFSYDFFDADVPTAEVESYPDQKEQEKSRRQEVLGALEDIVFKSQLNWSQMSQFLGENISFLDTFIIPDSQRMRVIKEGLVSLLTDARSLDKTRQVLIFLTEKDSYPEIEARIIHEWIHNLALQVEQVYYDDYGEYPGLKSIRRRAGMLLNGQEINSTRGMMLEEMMGCFAQISYLEQHASDEYWQKVATVFNYEQLGELVYVLSQEDIIIDSQCNAVLDYSLYAHLAKKLIRALEIDGDSDGEKIRTLIALRKTPRGMNQLIRSIERTFGKGTYRLLRETMVKNGRPDLIKLQEVFGRLESPITSRGKIDSGE